MGTSGSDNFSEPTPSNVYNTLQMLPPDDALAQGYQRQAKCLYRGDPGEWVRHGTRAVSSSMLAACSLEGARVLSPLSQSDVYFMVADEKLNVSAIETPAPALPTHCQRSGSEPKPYNWAQIRYC